MKVRKKKNIFPKIILCSLVVLLCFVFYGKYSELLDRRSENEDLKAQISEQEEYSKELDKKKKEYSSDEYVEEYARTLGLVKPDEKIFRNYNDKE